MHTDLHTGSLDIFHDSLCVPTLALTAIFTIKISLIIALSSIGLSRLCSFVRSYHQLSTPSLSRVVMTRQ